MAENKKEPKVTEAEIISETEEKVEMETPVTQAAPTTTSNDEDMPAPETKSYDQYLVLKDKFFELINATLTILPYNTVLSLPTGQQIKLSVLLKTLDDNKKHMAINDMNTLIMFIATAPYRVIKPVMDYIEDQKKQSELWDLVQG